jgi:hypothetical protein
MASGEIISILKETLVKMTLEQCLLMACMFVANISNEFVLRMDVLHAHGASVDLVWHVLQIGVLW